MMILNQSRGELNSWFDRGYAPTDENRETKHLFILCYLFRVFASLIFLLTQIIKRPRLTFYNPNGSFIKEQSYIWSSMIGFNFKPCVNFKLTQSIPQSSLNLSLVHWLQWIIYHILSLPQWVEFVKFSTQYGNKDIYKIYKDKAK